MAQPVVVSLVCSTLVFIHFGIQSLRNKFFFFKKDKYNFRSTVSKSQTAFTWLTDGPFDVVTWWIADPAQSWTRPGV